MVLPSPAPQIVITPPTPPLPAQSVMPSDRLHTGIKETLQRVLADKYVVLIDYRSERGMPPADVLQRLPHDLRVVLDRAAVADAEIPANALAIAYAGEVPFSSIRGALAGTMPTVGFVQDSGNPVVFVDIDDARHLIQRNPHTATTFVNSALCIAKECGKGAEVVSYDGALTQAAVDEGFNATFPLREWSAQPSRLEWATSGLRSMADTLRRSLTSSSNERRATP
ncbi:hypothetical protein PPN31114_04388 [Pandoraea pneumonica]|uniref:Uncharacterized protein n=2 Tax=Pandoraea pneumonica TaxID=2508299 RepID=A0A5E4YAJ1_9BURK|nr:hypothetical protein PPN31114_04388 [Pandoraea pneumonica]